MGALKILMAACVLVGSLGLSVAGFAQEADRAEAAKTSERAGERRQLGFILLGTSCALGLGMVGAFFFIRYRSRCAANWERERGAQWRDLSALAGENTMHASSHVDPSAQQAAPAGVEASRSSPVNLAPQSPEDARAMCPTCSRMFPANQVVCPHDSSTLMKVPEPPFPVESKRPHPLDRMVCQVCDRRFALGVDYCYHDGVPLVRDTREQSYETPTFLACDRCGWEGKGGESVCPKDGGAVVEIDPSDASQVQPTIPLMVCPKCRQYGAPGQAFCADDGELLTPKMNARLTEFPARGFGPRRKICNQCGTEHGGHATHCSKDGTKLVALN